MTKKAKEDGCALDPIALWAYFIGMVRKHLHVVLCFSPVGDGMRNRCLKFPALVNCCTIDWFQPWPEEALQSVAARFMADIELPDEGLRDKVT